MHDSVQWANAIDDICREYENAVVYGDFEKKRVLHEGEAVVLDNGWVELPTGRLLSPEAVHHVDPIPEAEDGSDGEQPFGDRYEEDELW